MSGAEESGPNESFWGWSTAAYERDGVAQRLLALQDDLDLNVNLLLWCAWCAQMYEPAPDIVFKKALDLTTRWSSGVTGALRSSRRLLKSPPRQADLQAAAALRNEVKACELAAEHIEQSMLEQLAKETLQPAIDRSRPSIAARTRRGLAQYAAAAGAVRREGFSVMLLDGLAACLAPSQIAEGRLMTDNRPPEDEESPSNVTPLGRFEAHEEEFAGANDESLLIKIHHLEEEHTDLDTAISALETQPHQDRLTIARLKKKKLSLKDRIQRLRDQLTPDIIA